MRSAPTNTRSTSPRAISVPTLPSVTIRNGTPARPSSHAVSRAVRGGDPDRGRPAHRHAADRVGDLLGRRAAQHELLGGQQRLVQKLESIVAPGDGNRHLAANVSPCARLLTPGAEAPIA